MAFFARPSVEVAPALLGSTVTGGGVTIRLTEVEAYAGLDDPASHAFRGPTPRAAVMFGPPARLYVYLSHGIHHCLNLVCGPAGTASAVLLRAGEVVDGLDLARTRRPGVPDARLARGPGNLARALGTPLGATGSTLWSGPVVWAPRLAPPPRLVLRGPRTGVRLAADRPLRFWLPDDPTVSPYRRHRDAPRS